MGGILTASRKTLLCITSKALAALLVSKIVLEEWNRKNVFSKLIVHQSHKSSLSLCFARYAGSI